MSSQLNYEIFYAVIVYTLTALVTIGINVVFVLRARKSELLKAFLYVQMLIILWLIAKVLKKISLTEEMTWLWVVVQYFSITFFGTVFLDFCYYYRYGKKNVKWIRQILYSISFINYMVLFTNPFHGLFFKSITVYSNTFGPWFYVHTIFSYVIIAICYYHLIKALLRNDYHVPMVQVYLINIGLIVPIITNLVVVTALVPTPFDLTPVMFNLTIVIFGYSAYRYRFLDIKKVTRSMVLENIHEGIVIVDNNMQIVQVNSIIKEDIHNMDDQDNHIAIKDYIDSGQIEIEEYEEIATMVKNCIKNKEDHMSTQLRVKQFDVEKSYLLKVEKLKDPMGGASGYVFRVIDVTKHRELIQNVRESNETLTDMNKKMSENISVTKQLAVAKERSRVSKEIHDILGHSVTIVISLLEISRTVLDKDRDVSAEKITQGMEIIRGGLKELKKSMREQTREIMEASHLVEELGRLIHDFEKSGVVVDFYYKESEQSISAEVFDTVYRVCQEGMTNALRHGKATCVTIGLRFIEGNVDLYLIDDGKGCENMVKGNGLSGMQNRVVELGGYFSCGSPDGQGFNIHANLPIG